MSKKETTAVAPYEANADLPSYLQGVDDNLGKENLTANDLELPRLAIAQALSKVCNPRDPAHIEGIKQGDIYNTLTHEVYGDHVDVVPILYRKVYFVVGAGEGADRPFYGQFDDERAAIAEAQEHEDGKIEEAALNLVLVIPQGADAEADPATFEQALIYMTSSAWKAARKWNSLVRLSRGPRFARAYRLHSTPVDGKKGFYYTWTPQALGYLPEPWFLHAKTVYESMQGTTVRAADDAATDDDTDTL